MKKEHTQKIFNQLKVLDKNYIPLVTYFLYDNKEKVYLGSKEKRVCRFCGHGKADGVTFKKEAHALSHLIGNNSLFSYYECDSCNQKFSVYENDLGEYMKFYHCVLKVSGKRGVPSYKIDASRIDLEDGMTKVKCIEGDPTLQVMINEAENRVTMIGLRSYHPLYVYKALLKMALSIMPDDDVNNCTASLNFINTKDLAVKCKLPVLMQIFGKGGNVFNGVASMILKRKENAQNVVFSYVFILAYNNVCFQMPIIGSKLDKFANGDEVTFYSLPTPPLYEGYPLILNRVLDLSSSVKVTKEKVPVSFTFESINSNDIISYEMEPTE